MVVVVSEMDNLYRGYRYSLSAEDLKPRLIHVHPVCLTLQITLNV